MTPLTPLMAAEELRHTSNTTINMIDRGAIKDDNNDDDAAIKWGWGGGGMMEDKKMRGWKKAPTKHRPNLSRI
jgi:hypothetical protein